MTLEMRRPTFSWPSSALLLLALGCNRHTLERPIAKPIAEPAPRTAAPAPAPRPVSISMLALNDLHGRLSTLPALGGYVANLRKARAKASGAVVVVDAGDMFQGTLESNSNEGAAVIAAYGTLGMTAAAIGNHEFDYGPAGSEPVGGGDPQGALKARILEAPFPLLCANLVERATRNPVVWPGLKRSTIVEVLGVKLGFIGVVTARTPKIVMNAYFGNLDVTPLADAVARESAVLRARGARLVVVLAHAGADCKEFGDPHDLSSCEDEEIFAVARALPPGTVDAMVGGHSHAGVAHVVEGVAIVEAYAHGRAFSRIDFEVDAHGVRHKIHPPHWLCRDAELDPESCELPSYEGLPVTRDPAVQRAIEPALAGAAQRRREPLGVEVTTPLPAIPGRESALGNLVADMMLASMKGADLAINNGGGLRAALPAGSLTYGSLYEALPFDNVMAVVEMTAEELTHVLERHLLAGRHGIASISGIRVRASCQAGELRVKLERKNGAPIKSTTRLVVATSNYLAGGGDGLFEPLLGTPGRVTVYPERGMRDEVAARLRERGGAIDGHGHVLFDPERPRLVLPMPRPVQCRQ